jgi:VWFA-related protein
MIGKILSSVLSLSISPVFFYGSIQEQEVKLETNLVTLQVLVTDSQGRDVPNLEQKNFFIFEDDNLQNIALFNSYQRAPASIAVLVDTSNSMAYNINFLKQSVSQLVFQELKASDDILFVDFSWKDYGKFFSSRRHTNGFISNRDLILEIIQQMRIGGSTPLYDSIYFAVSGDGHTGGLNVRALPKAVILFSDGLDSGSKKTRKQIVEELRESETIFYAVSAGKAEHYISVDEKERGEDILSEIANACSGEYYLVKTDSDLKLALDKIVNLLRAQYALGYSINNREQRKRKVRVRVDLDGDGKMDDAKLVVNKKEVFY